MATSNKAKEIDQGKLITVAPIAVGLIMSIIYGIITGNILNAFFVLLTALVSSFVVRLCPNFSVKF